MIVVLAALLLFFFGENLESLQISVDDWGHAKDLLSLVWIGQIRHNLRMLVEIKLSEKRDFDRFIFLPAMQF